MCQFRFLMPLGWMMMLWRHKDGASIQYGHMVWNFSTFVRLGKKMDKSAFSIAIFGACFLLVTSDHIQKNELRGFTKRNADAGHHFLDHRKAIRAKMHKLMGNKQYVSDASSMIQYARGLFGLNSRYASLEKPFQLPKVSCCKDRKLLPYSPFMYHARKPLGACDPG